MSSQPTALGIALSPRDGFSIDTVKKSREAIKQLINEVLIEGIDNDYAIIPTTKKKTLLKPGAEKICSLFGIAVNPTVEVIREGEDYIYRVTCRMTSIGSGLYLGTGVGEASTLESKFAWREAVCEEEFEATEPHRRRIHWKKGWNGAAATSVKQVRENPHDKANNMMKMAKKRAMIDGVLTVTAASDSFTQDLEGVLDAKSGRSSAGVSGRQVEESRAEDVISTDESKAFYSAWVKDARHTKEEVREYLKIHCGGITDDRKMPKRCYKDAMAWAVIKGAPIPPVKKPEPAPAAAKVVEGEFQSVDQKAMSDNIKASFDILDYNVAEQASLYKEYSGRLSDLETELKSRVEAQIDRD